MIRLKITDEPPLFSFPISIKPGLSSFPDDPKGDLIIKLFERSFNLQKNILGTISLIGCLLIREEFCLFRGFGFH